MQQIVTTMTRRGQITIPDEVRRLLRLKPHDKVAFTIENGEVRLVPVAFTLETAFGSVPPLRTGDDIEEQIRNAKDERAGRVLQAVSTES
ncbi:MAG: AbrB/MazE/SpoVT family DNA-binding domain-containing protein [Chloroflexi bacterium]|nr:MAG: AbrB/MazE/SpoVT family DNA-binding domain-containing protein [Chloroflexota bacterium]